MTAPLNAPNLGSDTVVVCGDRAGRLALSGELAAGLNETMICLARLESDLGADIAAFARPLRQALTDLCGHVDRAAAFLAEAAMDEPTLTPGCIDEDRFQRLLDIAGPDTAAELLHRMHLDLRGVRDRLDRALSADDWNEIRAQTHVLVSLAGTVGAVELQRLAEVMNAAAHRHDHEGASVLHPELLAQLDTLLGYVAQKRDGR